MARSGQPNTVSVSKILAEIVLVFGVSEICSFGDSAELRFSKKTFSVDH